MSQLSTLEQLWQFDSSGVGGAGGVGARVRGAELLDKSSLCSFNVPGSVERFSACPCSSLVFVWASRA